MERSFSISCGVGISNVRHRSAGDPVQAVSKATVPISNVWHIRRRGNPLEKTSWSNWWMHLVSESADGWSPIWRKEQPTIKGPFIANASKECEWWGVFCLLLKKRRFCCYTAENFDSGLRSRQISNCQQSWKRAGSRLRFPDAPFRYIPKQIPQSYERISRLRYSLTPSPSSLSRVRC